MGFIDATFGQLSVHNSVSLHTHTPILNWEHSRSVTLYEIPALCPLTVATFIQGLYVDLLLSFNICCQLIFVGREYIGCRTITPIVSTKCWSEQKMKIIPLIYCSYRIDVGNWKTIVAVALTLRDKCHIAHSSYLIHCLASVYQFISSFSCAGIRKLLSFHDFKTFVWYYHLMFSKIF